MLSNLCWLWRLTDLALRPVVASRSQRWTQTYRPRARLCAVAMAATATLAPPGPLPPQVRHANQEEVSSGRPSTIYHHKKGTEPHR